MKPNFSRWSVSRDPAPPAEVERTRALLRMYPNRVISNDEPQNV